MAETTWTARVEWLEQAGEEDLEDLLDTMASGLPASCAGALAVEEWPDSLDRPTRLSLTVTVTATEAPTAPAAAQVASRYFATAYSSSRPGSAVPELIDVEAITTAGYERRLREPAVPDLVTIVDIAELLGVSRQRVHQLIGTSGFPAAATRAGTSPLWVRSRIQHWATTWIRRPGTARVKADETDTSSRTRDSAQA